MARMATVPSTLLPHRSLCHDLKKNSASLRRGKAFRVRAAKVPAGVVEMPKVKPKLTEPFLGFTKTAEVWDSRACMIGIIGTSIVELRHTSDDRGGCGKRP